MTAWFLLLALQLPPLAEARKAMARADYSAARAAIDRALAQAADDPAARFLSGFLFYLENEMPRAIAELERAAQLNPTDSRPLLYLAMSLESAGRTEEAESRYRAAIALVEKDPVGDSETFLAFARFLMVQGDLARAATMISRALKIAPKSRDARFEHARLLLLMDKPDQAAREAERALACPPGGIPEEQVRYVLSRARRLASPAAKQK